MSEPADIEVSFGAPTPEVRPFESLQPYAPQPPEFHMSEPSAPVVPPLVVKIAAGVAAVAGVILVQDFFPDHTIIDGVCRWIVAIAVPLGIYSGGVRKAS